MATATATGACVLCGSVRSEKSRRSEPDRPFCESVEQCNRRRFGRSWTHVGPGAERANADHSVRPARNAMSPRCASCDARIEEK
jgi:hypothetical protein